MRAKPIPIPTVLTVGGSDSGGGAGIQADLRTFAAMGVHGTSVITCLTAQNPARISGIHPSPALFVLKQLRSVFGEFPPRAIKTGALCSGEIVQALARFLARAKPPSCPLIIDPVLVSSSGSRLLTRRAESVLTQELFPQAALITPNLPEASHFLGRPLKTFEEMQHAGIVMYERFGVPILLKGGHLAMRGTELMDFYYDGERELCLRSARIYGVKTHGTGCTYAAAIAGACAKGATLIHAVELAKDFVHQCILSSRLAGRWPILWPSRPTVCRAL